jgi:serine/threonine-protein kinase
MPAEVVLQVIRGKFKGKAYRFRERALCLVGRAEDCAIRLPGDADHRCISRHHCLLDVDPPEVRIQDFGSRNGTYLNGTKIGQRAAVEGARDPGLEDVSEWDLKDGDEVRVGSIVFQVRVLRPACCGRCGAELPPAAQGGDAPAGALCAACRQADAGPVDRAGPACPRCGKPLPLPGGGGPCGAGLCAACVEDPRRLVEELLERARAGQPGLEALCGFTLVRELGCKDEGGVYLARNARTGERVALKVLFPRGAADRRTRRRFLREAQNTMALKHPNVVQLRDAGCCAGLSFMALEYCEGGTLLGLMRQRGGTLGLDEAAPLILQALDGLEYSHGVEVPFVPHDDGKWAPGRGLVHRDVKPSNIFLAGCGGDRRAKVGDYGLAKAYDKAEHSGDTLTGTLSGTPYFMPRQQVLGFKYARPEVDVWALAATFYYVLTGQPARDFGKANGWMEVVLETPAVPIRQRLPALPARVAEVLDVALIDSPEIPFQTAACLKEALVSVL